MEQIVDLINGLVDVARKSHEMQQINMLYSVGALPPDANPKEKDSLDSGSEIG